MQNDSLNTEKHIITYLLNCKTIDNCNYSTQNEVFIFCLLLVAR
jgi:hypothetical protein